MVEVDPERADREGFADYTPCGRATNPYLKEDLGSMSLCLPQSPRCCTNNLMAVGYYTVRKPKLVHAIYHIKGI